MEQKEITLYFNAILSVIAFILLVFTVKTLTDLNQLRGYQSQFIEKINGSTYIADGIFYYRGSWNQNHVLPCNAISLVELSPSNNLTQINNKTEVIKIFDDAGNYNCS